MATRTFEDFSLIVALPSRSGGAENKVGQWL
jgi:hypothetical protein